MLPYHTTHEERVLGLRRYYELAGIPPPEDLFSGPKEGFIHFVPREGPSRFPRKEKLEEFEAIAEDREIILIERWSTSWEPPWDRIVAYPSGVDLTDSLFDFREAGGKPFAFWACFEGRYRRKGDWKYFQRLRR